MFKLRFMLRLGLMLGLRLRIMLSLRFRLGQGLCLGLGLGPVFPIFSKVSCKNNSVPRIKCGYAKLFMNFANKIKK